ncbi:hypothetical protein MRB53_035140 [Persea americana]|uniref:Uncharacterized protein n=1 Tax=Persea americana TaxID=3435 RepID=A0ACC2K425_PERAE|nr:hypothetical protein MRB53_035140 [Persea americana]
MQELLALEERIGNVNTGLSERTIINCLRTRTHTSFTASSAHDKSSEMDQNSICVVCQAEYDENDKIGILGCGHDYHVDCIKRWLLLKNACPISHLSTRPLCAGHPSPLQTVNTIRAKSCQNIFKGFSLLELELSTKQ